MSKEKIKLVIRDKYGNFYGEWRERSRYGLKGFGKPTPEKLEAWRRKFNESISPGGCNAHLGSKYWIQITIEVYNQYTGNVVCKIDSPMFEIIP